MHAFRRANWEEEIFAVLLLIILCYDAPNLGLSWAGTLHKVDGIGRNRDVEPMAICQSSRSHIHHHLTTLLNRLITQEAHLKLRTGTSKSMLLNNFRTQNFISEE